ncbi:MAG: four helix bundle protein [Alphaproteobacteria bacterium]|nr:four helix bundle protein [Alphaproteobacteria bacterium]
MVWQKNMRLAKTVYEISPRFPKRQTYGLTARTRRSAIFIPSNSAESQNRDSLSEKLLEPSI